MKMIQYKLFFGSTIIETFEKSADWKCNLEKGSKIQRFRQDFEVKKVIRYQFSPYVHVYLDTVFKDYS